MAARVLGRDRPLRRALRTVFAPLVPFVTLAVLLAGLLPSSPPSGASSVNGDRSQIGRIEARIAAQGSRIQRLVVRYDEAQALAARLEVRLRRTKRHLSADHRAEAKASVRLRKVAVAAYVSAGGLDAPSLLTSSASNQGMASVYVDVAGNRLRDAADTFHLAQLRTRRAVRTLAREESRARVTMRKLLPYQRAARAAVLADNALLRRVKGNLHGLLAVAAARRAAVRRAAEAKLAARVAAQSTPAPAPTASPAPTAATAAPAATVAPGGYVDPLRAIGGLSPERIDMGVDYAGFGPIYPIGDGVVLNTVNGGWPGGTFIAYRLTDGPAAGLVVYAAEDIDPLVQVGQVVTPSTELGLVYAGPDGIETGWAAPNALGETMAAAAGQFAGANSTAFGANFSQLLQSLGAPGGILQNSPPSGVLPSGWPGW